MKNKQILSALVACLTVVLLAGTAFAFGTGNLTFTGTINVQTELSVSIVGALDHDQRYVEARILNYGKEGRVIVNEGALMRPGDYANATFVIRNDGTVPAVLSNMRYETFYEGRNPLENLWPYVDLQAWFVVGPGIPPTLFDPRLHVPMTLAVGEEVTLTVRVELQDFDHMYIRRSLELRVTYDYTLAPR